MTIPMAKNIRLSNMLPSRKSVVTGPRSLPKIGRNDLCPCGSGRKYKDCHLRDGEHYLKKLARQHEKQALREAGVPWYKRWLY